MEWTKENIDKLRELFLKKWESLDEDDRVWGDYLTKNGILLMGLRDVSVDWNTGYWNTRGPRICVENPTFEGRHEVTNYLERESSVLSNPTIRRIASEQTWYMIPEEFAKKALVLGLP